VAEMDIIIHILQNLPKEYENTVELLENNLENEFTKFEPKTKVSLIRLKTQCLDSKLNSIDQDPDQWIQRKLQILGHQVAEMDIIIYILQNLPKEYENKVELLENNLENEVANQDRVKEKLRSKFEPGKYKGNCSYCGIYGHKANKCNKRAKLRNEKSGKPEKGNGNEEKYNTPFPFSCYICNKRGHKAMDCPTKKKRSNGGRNKNIDEANCTSGYSDIALICNEELDCFRIL
jgi:hypothetical protein